MKRVLRNGRNRMMRSTVICALALAVTAGCATTVKTNVLMPGRVDQAAQFKSIAVMPFDGPEGKAFTTIVESTLANVIVDDKQYFQIVDRGSLDKALNEMKLSMTGIVDANTAAKVGRMVGAKGIYTGVVTASTVNDSHYTEKRQRCRYYRMVTDNKGRKQQECTRWYETTVSCTKRTASFAFTPKLVEVESSRLIFSNSYENAMESKGCSDESRGAADSQVMMQKVREGAVQKFRMDVAPYYTTMQFTLKDSTDGISSDAAKAKLKDGIKFASSGRMDRACSLWSDARAASPDSLTLLYNLGVCAETGGKPEDALALYQKADKMLTKPDAQINKALARVTDMIEKQKKLGDQVAK